MKMRIEMKAVDGDLPSPSRLFHQEHVPRVGEAVKQYGYVYRVVDVLWDHDVDVVVLTVQEIPETNPEGAEYVQH